MGPPFKSYDHPVPRQVTARAARMTAIVPLMSPLKAGAKRVRGITIRKRVEDTASFQVADYDLVAWTSAMPSRKKVNHRFVQEHALLMSTLVTFLPARNVCLGVVCLPRDFAIALATM